jgi:hypothetical protein
VFRSNAREPYSKESIVSDICMSSITVMSSVKYLFSAGLLRPMLFNVANLSTLFQLVRAQWVLNDVSIALKLFARKHPRFQGGSINNK